MSDQLELNCLVYGDGPSHIFPVKIARTESVGTLTEAIKEQKQHTFRDLDADSLKLWKVSIPVDDNEDELLQEELKNCIFDDKTSLRPRNRLAKVFPSINEDDLHIVIKRPPELASTVLPLHSQSPPPLLELNCWVDRVRPIVLRHIFSVKIASIESVGTLREAIKEEKRPLFDAVPANHLVLWKISVPVDRNLEASLAGFSFVEENSLSPVERLSTTFSATPVDGHLHIIVRTVPPESPHDILPPLPPSFSNKRTEYLKRQPSKAPSSQAELGAITATQNDPAKAFACGRPFEEATPSTLLDETLAAFRQNLENVTPSSQDCECFYELRRSMCQIYPNEASRRDDFGEILAKYGVLPRFPAREYAGRTKFHTDGSILAYRMSMAFLSYVQEIKNETSDMSSEAFFEAISYYLEYVRQNLESTEYTGPKDHVNFPAIISLEFGPYLGLAAAAFTSRPVVEFLACIPLFVHSSNTVQLKAGERAIAALRIVVNALQSRYAADIYTESRPRADFPFQTSFVADDKSYTFSYIAVIDGRRVFRAQLEDGTPIIIKFTQRYNEAVHRAAEAIGLAPKLYAVEDVYGWHMVVMADHSETFSTLYDLKQSSAQWAILRKVKDSLIQRLPQLHSVGYVHGDIRDVNVLVDKAICRGREGEILLVDWDWAGEEGKVLYPSSINTTVARPKEAVAGSPILASQDLAMVELFPSGLGYAPMAVD